MTPLVYRLLEVLFCACRRAVSGGLECAVFNKELTYSGWDIFYFYTHMFRNYFSAYPWQVKVSYGIVVACCVATAVVFTLFLINLRRDRREKAHESKVYEKYRQPVETILMNPTMSYEEMMDILGEDTEALRRNSPKYFMSLLVSVRMQEQFLEFDYLPNMQPLANLLGVREYMEQDLLRRRNVFSTLQVLLLFQLVISEGRLANYVNAGDLDIRMLARLCYILCSENDPYRYLLEDLNAPQSLMRPMMLDYVFAWIKSQNKPMPGLLRLSDQINNEPMAAFLIREVVVYGSEAEKASISRYFESTKYECRIMAIRAAGALADIKSEDALKECYVRQPENIKREILQAILHIGSGKSLQFLIDEYWQTPSRDTRETALGCIYNYSNEGIRAFAELKEKAKGDRLTLIEQVESSGLLEQIRAVRI